MDEQAVRLKLFAWLHEQSLANGHIFSRKQLESGFQIAGRIVTLVGASGIWTPAGFSMPISITTTIKGPYRDKNDLGENGDLIYRYRGNDPNHRDNVGLRELMNKSVPLVYFNSIKQGKYVAYWPVFIKEDLRSEMAVHVELNPVYMMYGEDQPAELDGTLNPGIRKYIWVSIRQRVHQTTFREFVLDAYGRKCTLCNLKHDEFLEAAHIIPDKEEGGEPVVPNGLSLCKIHHAAFDSNIIGISPDYIVKIRKDILEEEDGPMLKYGLQALDGSDLRLPRHRIDYPDKERLDIRYDQFLHA